MIPLVDTQAEYHAYGQEVLTAIGAVAESGRFILGPQVAELENALATRTQPADNARAVQCIAVGSGTVALQMALMALGVKAGDEVVTTPFTWIATAEVIALVGATPVFVDVNPNTFNLDVGKLADALTPRTRAVIVVSLFGLMPDLRSIRHVLDGAESKHWTRIALIEDGAQSFGAVRNGHSSCGSPFATFGTTSFFPTKPLACYGDGGAVFTQDAKLADAVRSIRQHGRNAKSGRHDRVGLNARLDTLQAAVLLVKLEKFADAVRHRASIAARYTRQLKADPRVVVPEYEELRTKDSSLVHVYAAYTVRIRERDAVAAKLRERGVACKVYYPLCCHEQPVFTGKGETKGATMPVAEELSKQVLSLPMHAFLTEQAQDVVVQTLFKCLDDCGVDKPPELDVDFE